MKILELERRANIEEDKKLLSHYDVFENLLKELRTRDLPSAIIDTINKDIEVLNSFSGANKDFLKLLIKKQTKILQLLEKELKLVRKNHYMTLWMSIGMAAFGLPMGAAFGVSLGNMAFIGVGLPLGIALGMAYGTTLDKKACEEGKQLNVDITF
ncbi:hypothetical protein [Ancylomarina euxinus]|uniref:hypothetical protein n=1 Tax=Ancylomarina euxinus TaxID=2283627 RepID=UPI0012E2D93B|nr:hypothetical protein [Ancylomarina euxinus]MCZ4695755.1 hypothetical protein [Ancylomarina euxinus]